MNQMTIKELINDIGVKIRLDKEERKHDKAMSKDALNILYKSAAEERCNMVGFFKYCKYVDQTNDVQAIYGRKWKNVVEKLSKLCSFAEDYQGEVDLGTGLKSISDVKVIGLPQTCKELVKLFGSHKNVCNVIKKAIQAGLLAVVQDYYHIGACSKLYAINPRKIAEIRALSEVKETKEDGKGHINSSYTPTYSGNIRFSSGRRLPGVGLTDKAVIETLHKNYPYLSEFEKLNEENNENLMKTINPLYTPTYSGNIRDALLLLGKFEPKVKRNFKTGVITGISIRETSKAAILPKTEGNFTREDLFVNLYGTKDVYEFDVKSSIYRVTYFMNKGEWLSNDVDFYQMISPYEFETDEDRENFKAVCQRFYFGKSPEQVFEKLWKKKYIEKSEENAGHIASIFSNMRKVVGDTYDSEIFLHESCIYMLLMRELIKRGYTVTQVYDGFYCDKDIEDLCIELLPVCAAEYAEIAKHSAKSGDSLGKNLYKSEDDGCKGFVEHVEKKMKKSKEQPLDCVDDAYNWTPPALY